MKKHLFFIPLLLFFLYGYNQPVPYDQKRVDSINASLTNAKDDSTKVQGLILLAQMYIAKPDSSLVMSSAKKAKMLAEKINYIPGIIGSLGQMAFLHSSRGDWPNAILEINEALPLAEKSNGASSVYLNNLMFINMATKNDLAEAKTWALKALHHPQFQKMDEMSKWPTYMQLGLAYEWENNLDSMKFYAGILEKYLLTYHHPDLESNSYFLLGDLARMEKRYPDAINYYRKCNEPALGLAWTFDAMNQKDSAIYYATLSYKSGVAIQSPRVILESSKALAQLHKTSNPALSNKYLQQYIDAKDELFNSNKLKLLEEIRLNEQRKTFEAESKEKALQNRIIQVSLIALALVLLVSAILLYRNFKIKQSANQKLEKAFSDLKSTQQQLIQSEKMASLGELTAGIAHEIQNPLNFVNNFSEVNKELLEEVKIQNSKFKIEELDDLLDDIFLNNEKINHHGKRADAIVKGMLQHSRLNSGAKEPTDINTLADEYLRLAYHGLKAKDKSFNATIKTDFDQNIGNINIIPQDIGRVLLNLINNAFYAVNEKKKQIGNGYEPEVSVSTKLVNVSENPSIRQSVNSIIISVRDNGNGIPEMIRNKIFQPFFTTKPTGQGTGLGLSLSYDIIKAHGGEIKVNSKPGEGAEFIISLPMVTV